MDEIEYTIQAVPPALDAALRRRARARGVSLNRTVIDTLATALKVPAEANADPGSADPAHAAREHPPELEQDALDEGIWL